MIKNHAFAIVCLLAVSSGCQQASEPTAAPRGSGSTTPTTSTSSEAAQAIELVPKVSLGPVRLGASKADIAALGILEVHPQYSAMTVPYSVDYDANGKAQRIQLSLKYAPGDVTVGSLTIPRTATFDEVKALLGDCTDRPAVKGGHGSDCRGGLVAVTVGSGSPDEVWLEVAAS